MPRPHTETIFRHGLYRTEKFCRAWNGRWPDGEHRLDVTAHGHSITMTNHERWLGPDAAIRIAQLRYEPTRRLWTLYWANRSGRWLPYNPGDDGAPYIGPLLDVIAEDADGAFFG